jgi:hypothetical protein
MRGATEFCILFLLQLWDSSRGDISFPDFNTTTGLIFNADAATSNCDVNIYHTYGDVQGKSDVFDAGNFSTEYSENTDLVKELTIETNVASTNSETTLTLASFPHRNDTTASPATCAVRARLTPSGIAMVYYGIYFNLYTFCSSLEARISLVSRASLGQRWLRHVLLVSDHRPLQGVHHAQRPFLYQDSPQVLLSPRR